MHEVYATLKSIESEFGGVSSFTVDDYFYYTIITSKRIIFSCLTDRSSPRHWGIANKYSLFLRAAVKTRTSACWPQQHMTEAGSNHSQYMLSARMVIES